MNEQSHTIVQVPVRAGWRDWLPLAALLITIGGMLLASGGVLGQVRDNTRRIVTLETSESARIQREGNVTERLARIEAKLDFIAERSGGRGEGRNGP